MTKASPLRDRGFGGVRADVLSLTEPAADEQLRQVDEIALRRGLHSLTSDERHRFARLLLRASALAVDDVRALGGDARLKLQQLRQGEHATYARAACVVLEELLERNLLGQADRAPLADAPVVLFVANMGASVPVSTVTLGNDARGVQGRQPPLGQYYVGSFLRLLGADARVFNLALGQRELDELQQTMTEERQRIWFVSFASNFLSPSDLDAVHQLHAMLSDLGDSLRPRLVGGGMGVYFSRDVYLEHTPLEIVISRYGEPSFGDMLFDSPYVGPTDERSNLDLFGHIPNLHIAHDLDGRAEVRSTPTQRLLKSERRVFALGFDVNLMQLPKKYWSPGYLMGICSPDDINIPVDAVNGAGGNPSRPGAAVESLSRDDFDLSNYIYKPKTVKIMTVFGNCPRGCRFCQFTKFDEEIFFASAPEAVSHLNRVVEELPDVHVFVLDDDDFLLRKSHVRQLISELRGNVPTQGRVFYVETVPMEIEPEIMRDLRDVGFRAMLLGIESPVERVARTVGKLLTRHSFERFIQAPNVAQELGFYTRASTIMFYPTATEEDLPEIFQRLTGWIREGIAVSVFPLVKALPGTSFVTEPTHEVTTVSYQGGDGASALALPDHVLPADALLRDIAWPSTRATPKQLADLLSDSRIEGDHPMALGVLAFFSSIVAEWRRSSHRQVSDEVLDRVEEEVAAATDAVFRRHVLHRELKALCGSATANGGPSVRSHWLEPAALPVIFAGLRTVFDFGDTAELRGAALVAARLARDGAADELLAESARYALGRPLPAAERDELETLVGELSPARAALSA